MEIEFLAIADGLRFMPNVCEHSSSMQCKISINEPKIKSPKNRNWPLESDSPPWANEKYRGSD